ncbi:MAG TPA: hypothetical protein VM618_04715 [Acidimicrobiia bacterium]|nr:hypothetical protein [Acidimicrobiia bacterium]
MRVAAYGIDADRVGEGEPLARRLRRRWEGRYSLDPFGADPMAQDLAALADRLVRIEVEGGEVIPQIGPVALVCNSRPGSGDALAVRAAVRAARRRRARIVGYPDLPVVGALARRAGRVRPRGEDLGALMRAGHVAVVPLGVALGGRAGPASAAVLWGALGFPVVPVAVTGGAIPVAGVPIGRHRVIVGRPLDLDVVPSDPLSAAEVAESVRAGVQSLLDDAAATPR